jgi:hypothetical protein
VRVNVHDTIETVRFVAYEWRPLFFALIGAFIACLPLDESKDDISEKEEEENM